MEAPAEFLLMNAPVDWPDIQWAFRKGAVGWPTVVDFADVRLNASLWRDARELDLQLGVLMDTTVERWEMDALLQELAAYAVANEERSDQKWLYLKLLWLYQNRTDDAEVLAQVEDIYCEFDHPVSMNAFIQYLPSDDGYDPTQYSLHENLQRLFRNWKAYLDATKATFASDG